MEGNLGGSGMDNGNGCDPASSNAWIMMNVVYFIQELCKIAKVTTTNDNIFSQSVGESILQFFQQPQNELIRYQEFVKDICALVNIPTDGNDISSEIFLRSVFERVRKDLVLMAGIYHSLAERTSEVGNPETQPPSAAHHSNDHASSSSSESSEIVPNENIEIGPVTVVREDVKPFPDESQIITIETSKRVKTSRSSASTTFTTSRGNNHDEVGNTTPPAPVSQHLPEEGRQSVSSVMGNLAEPQIEVEVDSESWVDNLLNGNIQTSPLPSTSPHPPAIKKGRKSKNMRNTQRSTNVKGKAKKGKKQKVQDKNEKKIHAHQGFQNGFYCCTCPSKFTSKEGQEQHIKYFNTIWQFKCRKCPKSFYSLTRLKVHLINKHGLVNPLEDFVIGCTRCGDMFESRIELIDHQKRVHNIHKVPRRRLRKQEVVELVTVSDDEGDDLNGVPNLSPVIQGNAPPPTAQRDQQAHHSGSGNQTKGGISSTKISAQINKRIDYGECYGCKMCAQAFRDLKELRVHLLDRHQSNTKDVKCNVSEKKSGIMCGMVFGSSKSFHAHRDRNHSK